jgi:c-di-GMP-binding flagellar brake protein YcgR
VLGFLFGKKKPKLMLEPKQEVEIEIRGVDVIDYHFTRVVALERKKLIVGIPTQNKMQIAIETGDSITVTYLDNDKVCSFETTVVDKKEREIGLKLPSSIREEKTPIKDATFSLDIPIPVEYRAMSMAHLQTATTRSINEHGIDILTNLPIPINTSLHIELEIPNSPAIKTQGRVTQSQKLPDGRKALTQIDFEDISHSDRDTILRYAVFFWQRQVRKELMQA